MRRTGRDNAVCVESLEQALEERPETYRHIDVIAFGFPCQDISTANPKGKGLSGEKSSIFFECMRIARILKPQWLIIENVPRLLSINGGRDFAIVLQTVSKSGYGWAYRILDSQYFGVAQRRKRVFIVGYFGGQCPSEILFEPKSSGGNDTPKRKVRQSIGLCISTRDGERYDPTADTYIAATIQSDDKRLRKFGFGENLVAQTIGSTPRGNSSFVWQDTHIAEINFDRERTASGIPDKFHSHRGIMIGNAVSVPVAFWIGKRIMDYEANK